MGDIKTLKKYGEAVYTDRKSVFTARAYPVESEEDALTKVRDIKKQFPDARHNCYAYVLKGGISKRYSDDGEPQGTAGKPILDVIEKNGLEGVLVVVTRYFGGILLGTGGLVHAYGQSAIDALNNGEIAVLRECDVLNVRLGYTDYSRLSAFFENSEATIVSSDFGADVSICLHVPTALTEKVIADLTELTGGRVKIEKNEKILSF